MDEHKARFWKKDFPQDHHSRPPVFREGVIAWAVRRRAPVARHAQRADKGAAWQGDGDEILARYLKAEQVRQKRRRRGGRKKFLQVVSCSVNMANAMTWTGC